MLIKGLEISQKIDQQSQKLLKKNKSKPCLGVILIGEHKPSILYIKKKAQKAKKIGIKFKLFHFSRTISENNLIQQIRKIQHYERLSGLIIQLPLPKKLNSHKILNSIKPKLDIDFLTNERLGSLITKTYNYLPPTPGAIIKILKELKINLQGKTITIVGTGNLVGKPLINILINENTNLITCNSQTKNLKQKCLQADIIISAVGKKNLITADMIKKNSIVIDAGISFYQQKVYGDVDFKNCVQKAKFITPVPGGVGPITVSLLIYNTILNHSL